jgi:hypothetical protein
MSLITMANVSYGLRISMDARDIHKSLQHLKGMTVPVGK